MINDSQFKEKVSEDIGFIKATLNEVKEDVKRINGGLIKTKEKVARHDIIFGKIGIAVTAILFIFTIAINFVVDWVKNKF
jgi:uncharacterized membrane protein YcjF (UPF0283 family)